jgi:hypothetical protein
VTDTQSGVFSSALVPAEKPTTSVLISKTQRCSVAWASNGLLSVQGMLLLLPSPSASQVGGVFSPTVTHRCLDQHDSSVSVQSSN